jgi:hypothetical protein
MIASTLLYPFNLIRSRQQQLSKAFFEKVIEQKTNSYNENQIEKNNLNKKNNQKKEAEFYKFKTIHTNLNYGNFINTTKTIYSLSGYKGFYQGLSPLLIRQIPGSSAFFYTYEFTLKFFTSKFQ